MNAGYLYPWLERFDSLQPNMPKAIWIAAFLFPILLALFSRRSMVFLGCTLTATVAAIIALEPSSIGATIALGAYFGSILVAISGMQNRRRDSARDAELKSLRSKINRLIVEEERKFVVDLKTRQDAEQ